MSKPDFGMIDWTDAQMDAMFLRSEARPLDGFLNAGEHTVDLGAHEIYNDQRWKGFMPKGLPATEATARLSLGFAKKLWKSKTGFERRNPILRRHDCDETHGEGNHPRSPDPRPAAWPLCPFRVYRRDLRQHLLRPPETDQRRSHAVPRLHRAVSRRHSAGGPPCSSAGIRSRRWASTITTCCLTRDRSPRKTTSSAPGASTFSTIRISRCESRTIRFDRSAKGGLQINCDTSSISHGFLLPKFVSEHFQTENLSKLRKELRTVDRQYMVGKWTTGLTGAYAKFLLAGSPGLFHPETGAGRGRRFSLYYLLTRM